MPKRWERCSKHGNYVEGPGGGCPNCKREGGGGMLPPPGSREGGCFVRLPEAALRMAIVGAHLALLRLQAKDRHPPGNGSYVRSNTEGQVEP